MDEEGCSRDERAERRLVTGSVVLNGYHMCVRLMMGKMVATADDAVLGRVTN